jgi:hypothetical protein
MGDHPPGPLCGDRVGRDWIDAGTNCRSQSSSPGPTGRRLSAAELDRRKQAITLGAADARTLLGASLPVVLEHLTADQIEQMQMVLDAAVVDPEIKKEAQQYYDRSYLARSGSVYIRDPAMVRRYERILDRFIPIGPEDQRIRLDLDALLAPDALEPTTDNPDEATYLKSVKETLAEDGVWLRFSAQRVQDPADPTYSPVDPHTFAAWLALGQDGDKIPTESGRLTRDAIHKTARFGARYYSMVITGPVRVALEKEAHRLLDQIEVGLQKHQALAKVRRQAVFGVVGLTDMSGGADFPDQSIWEQPRRFVLRSLDLKSQGSTSGAQVFLVAAAVLARNAAYQLAQYIDDSNYGGESYVGVLRVGQTAGQIAMMGIAVTETVGVVAAIRSGGFAAGAATEEAVDAGLRRYFEKVRAVESKLAAELGPLEIVPGPKGTTLGAMKGGHSAGYGTGFDKFP